MAVWLTHGPRTVGIDDGVIRAADHAGLVEAAELVALAAAEREQLLAVARAQADEQVDNTRRGAG